MAMYVNLDKLQKYMWSQKTKQKTKNKEMQITGYIELDTTYTVFKSI